ncbi:MAG: DUF3795 domain-containing protein [Huintestinicola sp.]
MDNIPDSRKTDAELLAEQFYPSEESTGGREQKSGAAERCSFACCGADCSSCELADETECSGCRLRDDTDCEICICCKLKDIEDCSFCPDFPCDMLKAVAYDKETGDGGGRLLRLKEKAEKRRRDLRIKTEPLICGAAGGILTGVVIGGLTDGMFARWITVCTAVGVCIGYIISASKKR